MKIYLVEDVCGPDMNNVAIRAFRTEEDAKAELKAMYKEFQECRYIPKDEDEDYAPEKEFDYNTMYAGPGRVLIQTKHIDDNAESFWIVQNRCYPDLRIKGMPTIVASKQEGVKLLSKLAERYEEPVEAYYKRGTEKRPDFNGEDAMNIDHLDYMEKKGDGKTVHCSFELRLIHVS